VAIASHSSSRFSSPGTSTNQRYNLLELWHLLSLDAASVAATWTWFIASTNQIALSALVIAAIFLAVWMLYVTDRLLDAKQLYVDPLHSIGLEARHLFHHRYARAFLIVIAFAAPTLGTLLHNLLPQALELYAILGALLFAYLLLIHTRSTALRLPKEIAVGVFFPAASFIPTVARLPQLRLVLLPHAALLAAVCSLNCLLIYAWEHPDSSVSAHWSTRYATRHITTFTVVITTAGLALTVIDRDTVLWPLALAASLGALLLVGLHRCRHHLPSVTLRAAADLALLTPLLFLHWRPR
jgi:hypothetical protein